MHLMKHLQQDFEAAFLSVHVLRLITVHREANGLQLGTLAGSSMQCSVVSTTCSCEACPQKCKVPGMPSKRQLPAPSA